MKNILILDDDITLDLMLKTWLTKKNFTVRTVISVANAKKEVETFKPDFVLSDLRLPDDSGISFLRWIKALYPEVIVIIMTGYVELHSAVEAIRLGAYDYIAKPLNPEELLKKMSEAAVVSNKQPKVSQKNATENHILESDIIQGQSPAYKRVYEYVELVAPTNLAVFIRGNSGVGKEHIARMIHDKSKRAGGPFVPVDCGVMSKELSASDFFGHIKGSFTGAISNKKGHFSEANGGTLFLDEIGNLPPDIQMQLLRVLQEKKIKPVGASKEEEVDVRVVVATNEDMQESIAAGRFRADLYHRVNEFLIKMPALEECTDDVVLFANHFLEIANAEIERNVTGFDEETLECLKTYHWPGNIRELRNVIFRLVLVTQGSTIVSDLLPDNIPEIYNYYKKHR
jgi:two-component system response regulator HydG